jgi:hypothetical protein
VLRSSGILGDAVGVARYEYVIWRTRHGLIGRLYGDAQVTATATGWFDLDDGRGTMAEAVRLIREHGDRRHPVEAHKLELLDPGTGARKTCIKPTALDVALTHDGTAEVDGTPRAHARLEDVSDEALLHELAQRLRVRAAARY